MDQQSTFIIVRDDLDVDPARIITEGLLIGRNPVCELLLNHPAVSRMQAGIKKTEGNFYVYNLRPSNPFLVNGKVIGEKEALVAGDVLEIGPFSLGIDRAGEALVIKVSRHIAFDAAEAEMTGPTQSTQRLPDVLKILSGQMKRVTPAAHAAMIDKTKPLDIYWNKRIEDAGKMFRPSPLFPHARKNPSKKTRYNWTYTTDLARRGPAKILLCGIAAICLISVLAFLLHANAYAPAPVSQVHARASLSLTPAIAKRANDNSCTGCHTLRASMDQNCSSCHQAEAFAATVIQPHLEAGIGCVACHTEHQGANFRPAEAALLTCTQCHNDHNQKMYNGRRVHTPHGGTFGYPVAGGKWVWKGLDADEWSLKQIAFTRSPSETDDQWRSKQFHALHLYRVRAVKGLAGNADGELSCSSCHKSFNPIDRDTPRLTCAVCHNGETDNQTGRTLISPDQPNCTSCHVQHIKNTRHRFVNGQW